MVTGGRCQVPASSGLTRGHRLAWAVTSASSSAPVGARRVVDGEGRRAPRRRSEHRLGRGATAGGVPLVRKRSGGGSPLSPADRFAFALGSAVHRQRARWARPRPGRCRCREDVVGGVMHQQRAPSLPSRASTPGAKRVDGAASSGSRSALSTAGVGGGIDGDEIRGHVAHGGGSEEAFRVGRAPERPGAPSWSRRWLRPAEACAGLPADLAVLAEEEDLRRGAGEVGIG